MLKMKLLDRYIIINFLLQFLLVLAGLISIYLLVDFVERIDDFQEAGKPLDLALTYFLLKIPFIFYQISPVAILLAGVLSLGLMYRRLEIMSLNAAGISLFRIVLPVIIASLLATGLGLANAEWALPRAKSETDRIWLKEVKNKVVGGTLRNNHYYLKGKDGIYDFADKNPAAYQINDLNYTVWDSDYKLNLFVSAKVLSWRRDRWVAQNCLLKTFKANGTYDIRVYDERVLDLPETPEDFFSPVVLEDHLSLSRLIKKGLAELDEGRADKFIEMNQRLSLILLGLPLLLLTIPVMLMLHRRFSWELTMTIPASCLLAFTAWAAWNGAQALSQAKLLEPLTASWAIHLVMITAGLFLTWRQNNL